MKFRYSFQKIVDLRENEKTQAEWMLSQAMSKLREEEQELARLEKLRVGVSEQLHSASERSTPVAALLLMQEYLNHIDREIDNQLERLAMSHQEVSRKQEHLRDRMMQEQIWQKAKSKAFSRFRLEALRQEQMEMDEIASRRRTESVG